MKRTCLSLLLALCCVTGMRAQIIGGEVDYRCLGNGRYEVIVHLNHPCDFPPQTPSIRCLVGTDTLTADSISLIAAVTANDVPAQCNSADTCFIVFHHRKTIRRSFRGIFDLDTFSGCQTRFFVREPTTTWGSILSSRSHFYIETTVDRCLAPCDASPASLILFPPLIGNGVTVQQHAAVFNPLFPGDSFSYGFSPIRVDQKVNASYKPSYDSVRWIRFFGFPNAKLQAPAGMHLDPGTGWLYFRPTQLGEEPSFVMEVRIHRKINGIWQVVGRKYIENGMGVISSENSAPQLFITGFRGFCHGQRTCVTLTTNDIDSSDSTFIYVKSDSIPNLEISYYRTDRLGACEVCWTPDSTQINKAPFVDIEIKDDHCPIPMSRYLPTPFTVKRAPEAHHTVSLDPQGFVSLSATPFYPYADLQHEWRIYDNQQNQVFKTNVLTTGTQLDPGKHIIHLKLLIDYCFTRYTDTVEYLLLSNRPPAAIASTVYPNPFVDHLLVEAESVCTIQLFNSLGQTIPILVEEQNDVWQIMPVTGPSPGMYWLWIQTENGTLVEKLVKH